MTGSDTHERCGGKTCQVGEDIAGKAVCCMDGLTQCSRQSGNCCGAPRPGPRLSGGIDRWPKWL